MSAKGSAIISAEIRAQVDFGAASWALPRCQRVHTDAAVRAACLAGESQAHLDCSDFYQAACTSGLRLSWTCTHLSCPSCAACSG